MEILLISGLLIFSVNYITGWLLYAGKISIGKKIHQIMFIKRVNNGYFSRALSLLMMAILPFGKKGGRFHIIASSAGIILFIMLMMMNYNNGEL